MNIGCTLLPVARIALRHARIPFALAIALLVSERLLLVVGAVAVSRASAFTAVGTMVGIIYFARSATRGLLRLRAEAALYKATLAAVFREHHNRDVSLSLTTAVQEFARTAAVIPDLVGDAVAAALVAILIVYSVPLSTAGAVISILLAATLAGASIQRLALATSERYWDEYQHLLLKIQNGMAGREELIVSAHDAAYRECVRHQVERVQRLGVRSTVIEAFTGRIPTVIAALCCLGWLMVFRDAGGWNVHQALLLGAFLPPLANVATAFAAVARTGGAARTLNELLMVANVSSHIPRHSVRASNELVFDGVTVEYDDLAPRALEDVTLSLKAKGLYVVSGANGSGKSTLLRAAVGLISAARGVITIDGRVQNTGVLRRTQVGYLAQRPYLPPGSVRNALCFLGMHDDSALYSVLKRMGLTRVLESKSTHAPLEADISSLSVGERQRLAIARFLLRESRSYFLDEPDANLDDEGVIRLISVLRALATTSRVVVVAHAASLVDVADELIVLYKGRLVPTVASAAGRKTG